MRWTNREEVRELAVWYQDNNLSLNVSKTKELTMDYRKDGLNQAPININGAGMPGMATARHLTVRRYRG